jgi:DME family drug/metabolite transporter
MRVSLCLICLAAITWGTTGTTLVLLSRVVEINPLVVGFWRMALASPFLLWMAGQTPDFWQWPDQRTLKGYLGLGVCIAAYQICYFSAVPFAGVAVTALVAICSSPVIIALLAAVFLGERLTARIYLSLGLGSAGTLLLVANPESVLAQDWHFLLGVLLALGAAFAYSGYATIAKGLVANVNPVMIAAYGFTTAALFLTPTLIWQPPVTDWLRGLPWLLYLGLVTTGLAYALYMIGLQRTPATVAGIAVLLEPLTAALIGVFFFQEDMGLAGAVGALLLLTAIGLLSVKPANAP